MSIVLYSVLQLLGLGASVKKIVNAKKKKNETIVSAQDSSKILGFERKINEFHFKSDLF